MKEQEKDMLKQREVYRYRTMTILRGILSILKHPVKIVVTAAFLVTCFKMWEVTVAYVLYHASTLPPLASMWFTDITVRIALGLALLSMALLGLYAFGRPLGTSKATRCFQRIGLANSAGEVPLLICKNRKRKKKHIRTREFESYGIPLMQWQEKKNEIESALNCHIVHCYEGKAKHRIIIETAPHSCLPDSISWQDKYLSNEDFELVLGVGYEGKIIYNMAKIPHALIGGSTGSGKTVLMKNLIHQCKEKGAFVWIADFKGGGDYPQEWRASHFVTDMDSLLICLTELVDELEARKRDYAETGIAKQYEQDGTRIPSARLVFVCDEIAEVLDKTGLDAQAKKQVAEVEALLATIARQGRAFGIHLLLGTQRPDSTILSGQIRSNIDFRVCGRADEILSKIILDNKNATVIPKDGQGQFILSDGTLFQAYYYEA